MKMRGAGGVARPESEASETSGTFGRPDRPQRFEAGLRTLEIVSEMAAVLASASSAEDVHDEIFETIFEALGTDGAAILLLDADGSMRCEATRGLPQEFCHLIEGPSPWDAGGSAPVAFPDIEQEPGLAEMVAELAEATGGAVAPSAASGRGPLPLPVRALAFVPLTYRSRLVGAFVLARSEPHDFPDEELRLARAIAGHAALAIVRQRGDEVLERSYRHLRIALEAAGMGTWEWDISSGAVVWSETRELTPSLSLDPFANVWQAFQHDIVEEDRERVLRTIEQALDLRSPYEMTYRVRQPDGEVRWMSARGAVAVDRTGCPAQIVGVYTDITDRKRHEDALAVLAEASEVLYSSLTLTEPLEKLARLTVPRLADWCVIHVIHKDGRVEQATVAHVDPDREKWARELSEDQAPDPTSQIMEVGRTGRSSMYADITDDLIYQTVPDPASREMLMRLGLRSAICVPLMARGKALGMLTLVTAESRRRYDAHDLALAEELGRRAGVAIDNARLYEGRSIVARTLQERLLPPALPLIPGLDLAARYLPAAAEVGGDFYDLFEVGGQGSGRWVVAMGDVCGKGVEAAALTGMIRSTLRALAMEHSQPSAMLRAVNEAILPQLRDRQFFTMIAGTLQRVGAGAELTFSCAGHVPPLVVRRSGVERTGSRGTLLGVFPDPMLTDCSVVLGPGDALVCFTDGATDQREEDDMARVAAAVSAAAPDAASIADAVAGAAELGPTGSPRDDVAALVVRVDA